MFAGPNGSGKSTLFKRVSDHIHLPIFVNADDIQVELNHHGFISLADYGVEATSDDLENFDHLTGITSKISTFSTPRLEHNVIVTENRNNDAYLAAFLAAFIRYLLVKKQTSFCFETVMSHHSKVDFLRKANEQGFRTYLYFIATDSPHINMARVAERVLKGGHPVAKEKILSRYYRSLELLLDAVKTVDRAYIFDNSGITMRWVAESEKNNSLVVKSSEFPPWLQQYVISKIDTP
mgnify:CR=1 FL=1